MTHDQPPALPPAFLDATAHDRGLLASLDEALAAAALPAIDYSYPDYFAFSRRRTNARTGDEIIVALNANGTGVVFQQRHSNGIRLIEFGLDFEPAEVIKAALDHEYLPPNFTVLPKPADTHRPR